MKPLKTLSNVEFQTLFPVLEGIPLAEIARLRSYMSECPFKRRDVLMKQGEQGGQVLFLERGRIKVVTGSTRKKSNIEQTVVSFCVHGELLGEINALTPGGHSADVIAEETCCAWSMEVNDFLDCLAKMPRLSLNISRLLAQRTRKATEQLHIVTTMSAEQRVAYNLNPIAQTAIRSDMPLDTLSSSDHATPSVTIADLSSMCGYSTKQVHRALTKLHEASLIELTKGQVHILDHKGLENYALNKQKLNR